MKSRIVWLASLAVVLGAVVLIVQQVRSQDEAADDTPEAVKKYQALSAEFQQIVAQLAQIEREFQFADARKRAELRARFEPLAKKAQTMEPEFHKAIEQAYVAQPDKDAEHTQQLISLARRHLRGAKVKEGQRLAQALLDGGLDTAATHELAGMAAFSKDDYATAQARFDKFGADKLTEVGKKYRRETKLRQAEAKADDLPRVKLETTKGEVVIELFENESPNSVANFISLVQKGFYDGLKFHRVIDGFMAQGGDPKGTGAGGPGYNIKCECHEDDARMHFRGTLSMAHAGRDTGGSQFFLTFVETHHLDNRHTAFGRVIKGIDVLDKLHRTEPRQSGELDRIKKATVVRKRDHEYKPQTHPGMMVPGAPWRLGHPLFAAHLAFASFALLTAVGSSRLPARESAPSKPAAAAAYHEQFQAWKTTLKDLYSLRIRYTAASSSERTAIERQYEAKLAESAAALNRLAELAEPAFDADPDPTGEPARHLVRLALERLEAKQFERARRLATRLIGAGVSSPVLRRIAYESSFALNDFTAARKHIEATIGRLPPNDSQRQLLDAVKQHAQWWAIEQRHRRREARADNLPRVRITTTKGDVVLELFEDQAPNTVANFVRLVERGFFDGLPFNQVAPGAFARSGDPSGDGQGHPGYLIASEAGADDARRHFRGMVAMVAMDSRKASGSQFYITMAPYVDQDGQDTVFGRVVEGMDVVDRLHPARIGSKSSDAGAERDKILRARVIRKRRREYRPKKLG